MASLRLAPARSLNCRFAWSPVNALVDFKVEPDWDLAAQPAPDFEAYQRINWRAGKVVI